MDDDDFGATGRDRTASQYGDEVEEVAADEDSDDVVPLGNEDEEGMQYTHTQSMLGVCSNHLETEDRATNTRDFDLETAPSNSSPPPPPPPPSPVGGLSRNLFNQQGATPSQQCHETLSKKEAQNEALYQQEVIRANSSESSLLKHVNSIRELECGTRVIPYGPLLRLSDGCHLGFTKKVPPKSASRGRRVWHNIRFGRAYAPDSESGEYTKIFFFDLTCPEAKVLFSNQPELLKIIEEVTKQPDPPSSWVSSDELARNVGN